jgi:hypothetical protein
MTTAIDKQARGTPPSCGKPNHCRPGPWPSRPTCGRSLQPRFPQSTLPSAGIVDEVGSCDRIPRGKSLPE